MAFAALVIRTAARSRPPQRASAKRAPPPPPPPPPTQTCFTPIWNPPLCQLFTGASALPPAATSRTPAGPKRYLSSSAPDDWLVTVVRESGDDAGATFRRWAQANSVKTWAVVAAIFEVTSSVDQTQQPQQFKSEFKELSAVQRGSLWAALKAQQQRTVQPPPSSSGSGVSTTAAAAGGNGGGRVLPIAEVVPLLQRELVDTAKLRGTMRFDFVERPEYMHALDDLRHNIDKSRGSKYRVSVFTAGPGVGKTRFGSEAKQQLQRLAGAAAPSGAATTALTNAALLHLPWGNGEALDAASLHEAPIEYWLGVRMVLVQLAGAEDRSLPSGSDVLRLLRKHGISLQSFAVTHVYDWLRDSHHASAVILHLDEFQQLLLPEPRDVRGPRPTSASGEAMCRALLPCFGRLPTLLLCTGTFNQYTDYLPLEPTLGEVRWHRLDPLDAIRAQRLALQAVPGVATTDALQGNQPLRFLVDALGGIPRAFEELLAVMSRDWQQRPPHPDDGEAWRRIWQQLSAAARKRYTHLDAYFDDSLPGFQDRLLVALAALAGARVDLTFRMPSGTMLKEALTSLPITLTADGTIRFPLLWMSAAMPEQRMHLPKPLEALASYFLIERVCTDLTWHDYEKLAVLYVQFRSWLALQHPSLKRDVLDGALPAADGGGGGGGGSGYSSGLPDGGQQISDSRGLPPSTVVESQFVSSAPEFWPLQGRLPQQFATATAASTSSTAGTTDTMPPDVLAVLVGGKALYDGLVVHRLRHHVPLFLWLSCKCWWTDTTFAAAHLEQELDRFEKTTTTTTAIPAWCQQLDGSSGRLHEAAKNGEHVPVLFTTATWRQDRLHTPRAPLRMVDLAASGDYFGGTVAPLVMLTARSRIIINHATVSRLAAMLGGDTELADRIEQCRRSAPIADEQQLRRLFPAFPEHLLPLVSYAERGAE